MSAYVPGELKRTVREHFANCCAYCQTAEDLTVSIFEIEHVLPRSAGGETVFENLCLACPTCNRYKSERTLFADPDTGQEASLKMNRLQMIRVRRMWVAMGDHPPEVRQFV